MSQSKVYLKVNRVDAATRYALRKGLAGVIVQGCVRDVDQVRELGLPVWSTHIWPIHPDKRGHGLVNASVVCESVEEHPGDLIIADGGGVIRVPRPDAETVVQAAIAKMRQEAPRHDDEAIGLATNVCGCKPSLPIPLHCLALGFPAEDGRRVTAPRGTIRSKSV